MSRERAARAAEEARRAAEQQSLEKQLDRRAAELPALEAQAAAARAALAALAAQQAETETELSNYGERVRALEEEARGKARPSGLRRAELAAEKKAYFAHK